MNEWNQQRENNESRRAMFSADVKTESQQFRTASDADADLEGHQSICTVLRKSGVST